jgi:hypothetical protein
MLYFAECALLLLCTVLYRLSVGDTVSPGSRLHSEYCAVVILYCDCTVLYQGLESHSVGDTVKSQRRLHEW